jgi:thiazole/oxazole-forming peptide maturase SagD family component
VSAPSTVRLSSTDHHPRLNPGFDRLARRVVSPLTGLGRTLGFMMRGRDEPRIIVSGAQLTGVEHLLGRKGGLTYHIGGCGIFSEEAIIRSVGETIERYAQVVKPLTADYASIFATESDMAEQGRSTLVGAFARPFLEDQYAQHKWAYSPLAPDSPVTWTPARSLITGKTLWAPAQLLYIGYQLRRRDGEPWLNSAVTTGSAAHTSPELAIRSALYELIHGDAAMGHWYSDRTAPQVHLGRRTTALNDLLDRHVAGSHVTPTFHYLELPGFRVHVTACVMRSRPGSGRGHNLGLGISSSLEESLYKAFLEAAAGVQLSKMLRISPELVDGAVGARTTDTSQMFDLDANVAHYARPAGAEVLERKFPTDDVVDSADLPADGRSDVRSEIDAVIDGYADLGAELVFADCTTPEARRLGFHVPRVWSPDTMSLCLPSAPPLNHPRFRAYGGVAETLLPHPYA